MAGGMQADRHRLPLGGRVAATRLPSRTRPRHCWITDPAEGTGRWPGLLVQWRPASHGWEGLVVYAIEDPTGPVLVQRWVDMTHLDAAGRETGGHD